MRPQVWSEGRDTYVRCFGCYAAVLLEDAVEDDGQFYFCADCVDDAAPSDGGAK